MPGGGESCANRVPVSTDATHHEPCPGVAVGESFGASRSLTEDDLALAVRLTAGSGIER